MRVLPLAPVHSTPLRRPRTVNFQVNDICNARCVMCRVWRHKRDHEMSVAELTALFADPYFSEVEHVGITGGEPTLRKDLADVYLALPDACKSLKGASFITHGLDSDRAIATYRPVSDVYRSRALDFHGMVSLDGLGAVHDRIRGRAGAFERATRTLFGLKMSGVPTSACCTIVASNANDVWHLLEWGYDKTYIRFRVGEFINRLSNNDATDEIRAFDAPTRTALISFFEHLIQSYESDESVRRTYASIVSQLAGGPRLVGCPYQDGRAINLDCRGGFAVCAPKGIPHPLGSDAARAVEGAALERASILLTHCARCIHDYHDDWTPEAAASRRRRSDVIARLEEHDAGSDPAPASTPNTTTVRAVPARVLVLGWYGTETIGDLAILAALVEEYRSENSRTSFVLPSQFPAYTRTNLDRLGIDCLVTDYGDPEVLGNLWDCDTVIIGGGPLMDVPQIDWLATIVARARALGRRTVVEGCGVGPLNLPRTVTALQRITSNLDTIRVRDRASARRLRALGFYGELTVVSDPAARWAGRQRVRHRGNDRGPICVFARELTHEYPQPTSPDEATRTLVTFLQRLSGWFPQRQIDLHAMHVFPIGGDDRTYARRLRRLLPDTRCTVDEVPRTPRETLDIMADASLVIAMRYHSVVFAHAVGVPFLAIDYTNGGKVFDYALENGLHDRVSSLGALSEIRRDDVAALAAPAMALP